jgi:pyruvate-formate lyase-activating enzyme
LRAHLENCALTYGCPAGKNFFLGRYEAPLPTSKSCNARCLGCISLQEGTKILSSQDRINFTPTPKEIAQVALAHIKNVPKAVVSFGQGCEGDPLMAAETIIQAIHLIRKETDQGTINMNTNAGLPEVMKALFKAGLDSIRVSLNSVREPCYKAYFRPKGYRFSHVLESISAALKEKVHVAVNYLNCPGFSDTRKEAEAFLDFLSTFSIGMIQWRNLNFDPVRYMNLMNQAASGSTPMGMDTLLKKIRQAHPLVRFGYFNPPKEAYDHLYRN